MALTNVPSRETFYGNGVATSWATPFIFWDPTEIQCTRVDLQGVEHPLEYKVDFDVTGGGGKTGNVLYPISGDPLPGDGTEQNSEWLIANRVLELKQSSRLGTQGPYFANIVETALDKTNARIQQQQEQLDRSIKQSLSGAGGDLIFPPALASALIGWDEAGEKLRNWLAQQLGTVIVTDFTRDWLTSDDAAAGRLKLEAAGLKVANLFDLGAAGGDPISLIGTGTIRLPWWNKAAPTGKRRFTLRLTDAGQLEVEQLDDAGASVDMALRHLLGGGWAFGTPDGGVPASVGVANFEGVLVNGNSIASNLDYLGQFTVSGGVIQAVGVLTGYQSYYGEFNDLAAGSGGDGELFANFMDGAVVYATATHRWSTVILTGNTTANSAVDTGDDTLIRMTGSNGLAYDGNRKPSGWLTINDQGSAGSVLGWTLDGESGTNVTRGFHGSGRERAGTHNGLQLRNSASNLTGGSLRLWGVKGT